MEHHSLVNPDTKLWTLFLGLITLSHLRHKRISSHLLKQCFDGSISYDIFRVRVALVQSSAHANPLWPYHNWLIRLAGSDLFDSTEMGLCSASDNRNSSYLIFLSKVLWHVQILGLCGAWARNFSPTLRKFNTSGRYTCRRYT